MKIKFRDLRRIRLYLILISGFLIIGLLSVFFIRSSFLENMMESQKSIVSSVAHSYMYGEDASLAAYETVLRAAAYNIDEQVNEGKSHDELLSWANTHFKSVSSMFGKESVHPYIICGSKAYSQGVMVDVSVITLSQSEFNSVLNSSSSVAFTDVYKSMIVDKNVITAALRCSNSNIIVAMDIDVQYFRQNSCSIHISDNSAFYLCDSNGMLISMHGATSTSDVEHAQMLLDDVIVKIKAGDYDKKACETNYKGEHVGVYYEIMPNGWYSIVVAPHYSIIDNQHIVTCLFLAGLILILLIMFRDLRLRARADRANDTMRVLGNLYYAIYRINFKNDTYEIIKGSDYVESQLEKSGKYEDFMAIALEVISENAKEEFEASFSCDNIRMLVENNIKNFGGDFQRRFDDHEHWVNVRILYDETISTDEVILVFKNNEKEKKRSLNEIMLLKEALETAKISDKARQNFFKNMSHDMRTPLNAIIGLSKLAGEKLDDPEKLSEYINSIHHSGVTLLKLINEILDISKMQDGNILLDYKPTDIVQCISDCTAPFSNQAYTENKKFVVSYNVNDSVILGDSLRISQIVNNLLSNAFKFTKEGDRVELSLVQAEQETFSQYIITVSDTGVGMSDEFMLHLFEPYAREKMFSENGIIGTGLGLPITYNIITQMGGQITVKSKENNGSTFIVTLPFSVTNAIDEDIQHSTVSQLSLEGRCVLLAEDNILNMEVATEILKMNGAEVIEAWNGKEALEAFLMSEPFTIDAVLMDMNMPVLDGCGASKAIRESGRADAAEIPIIAVTANAFPEDIAATMEAGMNAHISKPIDTAVLCQTLEKLFSQSKEGVHNEG